MVKVFMILLSYHQYFLPAAGSGDKRLPTTSQQDQGERKTYNSSDGAATGRCFATKVMVVEIFYLLGCEQQ